MLSVTEKIDVFLSALASQHVLLIFLSEEADFAFPLPFFSTNDGIPAE